MYFISTIRIAGCIVDDCRTIGFNSNYGDLYNDVMNNAVDMFECGYYQYAVISYLQEGKFYPTVVQQQWFKYIPLENDNYEIITIDKPQELEGYSPYIIG